MSTLYAINEVVGFVNLLDHCSGRIILGQHRQREWHYLIDESPHNISEETATFLVANATNYHALGDSPDRIGPGLAFSCGWWPESKLKKRDPGTVCRCEFCERP